MLELEIIFAEMRAIDPAELNIALNHFERMWMQEKIAEEKTLLKATGSIVETATHAADTPMDQHGRKILLEENVKEEEFGEDGEDNAASVPEESASSVSSVESDIITDACLNWARLGLKASAIIDASSFNIPALLKLRKRRQGEPAQPRPKQKSAKPAEPSGPSLPSAPRGSLQEPGGDEGLEEAMAVASSAPVDMALDQFMAETQQAVPDEHALIAGVSTAISLGLDRFFQRVLPPTAAATETETETEAKGYPAGHHIFEI